MIPNFKDLKIYLSHLFLIVYGLKSGEHVNLSILIPFRVTETWIAGTNYTELSTDLLFLT